MIKINKANTAWLGSPVGTVTDLGWFSLSAGQKSTELAPFVFVEFKAPLDSAPAGSLLRDSGFFWTDVQINFRLSLNKLTSSPSLERYTCLSAAEQPFRVDSSQIKDFVSERFLALPGMTPQRLNERYATWANQLIERQPASCLQITLDGQVQGWFLGSRDGSTVGLALAMLSNNASSSGAHLYHAAVLNYAKQGCVLGKAAFSVRNTPVLNIYSGLGAQFTRPEGVWVWMAD